MVGYLRVSALLVEGLEEAVGVLAVLAARPRQRPLLLQGGGVPWGSGLLWPTDTEVTSWRAEMAQTDRSNLSESCSAWAGGAARSQALG